jgi:hypothetical protein
MMEDPTACYGLAVPAGAGLELTRPGAGRPFGVSLADSEPHLRGDPLLTWEPRPGHDFEARVYVEEDLVHVFISGSGWFRIERRPPHVAMPPHGDPFVRERRLWGIPAALVLAAYGDVGIHGASVQVGERAYLFVGPSHAGKTTLSAAFHSQGYRVLSDDLSAVCLGPHPMVWPGPPVIRLRHDMVPAVDLHDTVVAHRDEEKAHYLIAPEARGSSEQVPLGGIICLEWASRYELRPWPAPEALPVLWSLSANLPVSDDRTRLFGSLADMLATVPAWTLRRRQDTEGLDVLIERLVRGLIR